MYVTVERMAQRYGMLPTQVLASATTFDLYCMDVSLRYDHVVQQRAEGKMPDKPVKQLSEAEMHRMLKETRGQKHG